MRSEFLKEGRRAVSRPGGRLRESVEGSEVVVAVDSACDSKWLGACVASERSGRMCEAGGAMESDGTYGIDGSDTTDGAEEREEAT